LSSRTDEPPLCGARGTRLVRGQARVRSACRPYSKGLETFLR
jgi:hypothetical protein